MKAKGEGWGVGACWAIGAMEISATNENTTATDHKILESEFEIFIISSPPLLSTFLLPLLERQSHNHYVERERVCQYSEPLQF
jgi:hypothetical protein